MDQVKLDKIEKAEVIVSAYGAILSKLTHVNTAIPESILPHKKQVIRQALETLLYEIENLDQQIINGLIQSYVYLEQFISDNNVEIYNRGQVAIQSADPDHPYWKYADEAEQIINKVKAAMEDAMHDMRIYIRK